MTSIIKLVQSVAGASRILQQPGNVLWAAGGGAGLLLVLISCGATSRVMMVTPNISGATFAGSEACAACHEEVTRDFGTADHAKLMAKGENAVDMGCESCHGPGSKHVDSGGGSGTIHNPGKSAETCFQCHLDKRSEFSLPYSHPVLSGKMTCGNCHDPHKGRATKGGGTQLAGKNHACAECHLTQTTAFVFSHGAVRQGCSTCHNPHGSVNAKMLIERNSNLCLKCHYNIQTGGADQITIGGRSHIGSFLKRGTCWTSGCHEAPHGSNVSKHLRN